MDPFELTVQDDVLRCRIQGEFTLDATGRFKEALEPRLATRWRMVVVDLAALRFMDSSGIGALVALNTRFLGKGVPVHLLKPSLQVRRTLELVQLAGFFSMVEDEAALEPPGGTP